MAGDDGYEQAVRSWTEHLRHGGSTPWLAWRDLPDLTSRPLAAGPLSGAASLELVRRLADATEGEPPSDFARLADLVLSRGAPGRGALEQRPVWPGGPVSLTGPPPVDPSTVPAEELLRHATGLLADLMLTAVEESSAPEEPESETLVTRLLRPHPRRPWTSTPAYRLVGPPVTAPRVRHDLLVRRHPEGGRRPVVIVLVEPLDRLLEQVWSRRVQRGSAIRWKGFVRRTLGRESLPAPIDLGAAARRWAQQVGSERVHVVVVPDPARALPLAAEVLGVPDTLFASSALREVFFGDGVPSDLVPATVEVLRRVNSVVRVRVPAERRAAVHDALHEQVLEAEDIEDFDPEGDTEAGLLRRGLRVPVRSREQARAHADRLAADLASGGYRVHGDLGLLTASRAGTPTRPDRGEALTIAVRACLDAFRAAAEEETT